MRESYTDRGIRADDNPLSVTWHWGPLDDIDEDAFYEPVEGVGIAWIVPTKIGSYRPDGQSVYFYGPDYWAESNDYDRAYFKAVDTPFVDETGDGWRLMRNGDVDAVIYQGLLDSGQLAGFFSGESGKWSDGGGGLAKIVGPRRPRVDVVLRLVGLDRTIRG